MIQEKKKAVSPSLSLTELLRLLERQNRPLPPGEGDAYTARLFNDIAITHLLKGAIAALADTGAERSLVRLAEDAVAAINASTSVGAAGKRHVAARILALFNGVTKPEPEPAEAERKAQPPKNEPVQLVLIPPRTKRRKKSR